jgi:hypothetical protein
MKVGFRAGPERDRDIAPGKRLRMQSHLLLEGFMQMETIFAIDFLYILEENLNV